MLGSQIIDLNRSVAGTDVGIPEIRSFGFVSFSKAVATTDSWTSHDGPELVFLLEGEACWEMENEVLLSASGGQFVFFPAKGAHRIANGLYAPCESFWIVMSAPERSQQPALLTAEGIRDFHGDLGDLGLRSDMGPRCRETVRDLRALLVDPRIYAGSSLLIAEIRAQLHTVLVETWRALQKRQAKPRNSMVVESFLALLHEAPDTELGIAEAADRLGYSRSHLHERFRKEIGMSPSDYAQRLKIKRTCQRLAGTAHSVTDIATEFGFGSSQYFARVFRKYMGTTPSDYRTRMLARGR